MALAEQRQICIWNTLHMNPRMKNDDESKMRLGTELGNKVRRCLHQAQERQDWVRSISPSRRCPWQGHGRLGVCRQVLPVRWCLRCRASDRNRRTSSYARSRRHLQALSVDIRRSHGLILTDSSVLKASQVQRISDLFNIAVENNIIYKSDKRKYHYAGLSKQAPMTRPKTYHLHRLRMDTPTSNPQTI